MHSQRPLFGLSLLMAGWKCMAAKSYSWRGEKKSGSHCFEAQRGEKCSSPSSNLCQARYILFEGEYEAPDDGAETVGRACGCDAPPPNPAQRLHFSPRCGVRMLLKLSWKRRNLPMTSTAATASSVSGLPDSDGLMRILNASLYWPELSCWGWVLTQIVRLFIK